MARQRYGRRGRGAGDFQFPISDFQLRSSQKRQPGGIPTYVGTAFAAARAHNTAANAGGLAPSCVPRPVLPGRAAAAHGRTRPAVAHRATSAVRLLFLLALLVASPANAATTILVNLGSHAEATTAAHSEAKVNWLDADKTDDTVCTESFAAWELRRALRLATGRTDDFTIVDDDKAPDGDWILVGSGDTNAAARKLLAAGKLGATAPLLAKLGPEGYRIQTTGADGRRVIHLAGGGRVGTLYAAYDLLHRLGCRWFAPEPIHEAIPKIHGPLPAINVTETPSFFTRGFHAWENRGSEAFLLWMARNRMNYWCVQQANHPLVRKLGIRMSCGAHTAQKFFIDPGAPYPYDHAKFPGDEKKPPDPYPLSEDYRGDANKDGRLSYFEAHPEWYPLVGGKRVPGIRGESGTNYCSSNPHATTEFFKNYVQSLVDGPYRDADVVRFWTLDGGRWCSCDACRALGTPTDRNLLLVHRLDREIKKAQAAGRINRPLIVRFLAYADVLAPPSRPLPKDFDYATCTATFFPIVRSYVYELIDPRSPRNARYHSQLLGWAQDPKRHYRGQLCIGEYYNVSGYKCLPICTMHAMAKDIPTYYRLGARHFHYMHVVTANLGNKALTNYQMARQLWDVKCNCEALWKDYFARRYGPAAATMRAFYESLERMFCNVSQLKYGLARRLNRGGKGLFPTPELRYERKEGVKCNGPTFLEIVEAGRTCRKLIDQALAGRGKLPERIRARIAEDERLFTYGERTIGYYHACILAYRCLDGGDRQGARKQLGEAEKLADLLTKDTTSTKHSSSHANAANAFVATYATGALPRLRKLLGAGTPGGGAAREPNGPRIPRIARIQETRGKPGRVPRGR